MVNLPPDAPVTRREFHTELMIVWLFVVLASAAALNGRARWSAVVLPLGALAMLALHALALRRSLRASSGFAKTQREPAGT